MVPVELYIFHDTYYGEMSSRRKNYHTVPDSTKTKYIQGGLLETHKQFKDVRKISFKIEPAGLGPGVVKD